MATYFIRSRPLFSCENLGFFLLLLQRQCPICWGISCKVHIHIQSHSSLPTYLMDPEKLIQCPYDKSHQIRASRFPYHLVKCKKNNEKIARELATCPFNARHRIPKQEFSFHIANCENKVPLEPPNVAINPNTEKGEMTATQYPPSQEDWEADADQSPAPPFVFGASYSELKK